MNGATTIFRLMQEFPLWGKLDLKREMATFEATAAKYRRQGAEFELLARVKSVFAARYATFQAHALTERSLDTVTTAAATLRDRYTQGAATQEDVLRMEVEAEELRIEIERLRGQQSKTAAQLNHSHKSQRKEVLISLQVAPVALRSASRSEFRVLAPILD